VESQSRDLDGLGKGDGKQALGDRPDELEEQKVNFVGIGWLLRFEEELDLKVELEGDEGVLLGLLVLVVV